MWKDKYEMYKKSIKDLWWNYSRNKTAVAGLVVVIGFILMALAAPLLTPYSPIRTGVVPRLLPPSTEYPMGTDDLGRDVLARVIYSSQISLIVGLSAAALTGTLGLLIGAIAGYYGGIIDDILMRSAEVFQTLPRFFLAILLVALWGRDIQIIIFTIVILSWPVTSRVVRARVYSLKEQEFIAAAKSIGESDRHIIFKEIVPNLTSLVVVNMTLLVATAIIMEAMLAFLGLGDPNVTSWGRMLEQGQQFLAQAWWMVVFPGLAIFAAVLGFNLVGDGINDAFNPKVQKL